MINDNKGGEKMVITEQETEKKVAPNYFSNRFYTDTDTDDESDYSSSNYVNKYSSYNTTTEDDEPAFSVESEYKSQDDDEDEVSQYRVVTPNFITVEKKNVLSSKDASTSSKLSPRLKIALTVTSLVFALMIALVIYNAIAIGNMKKSNNQTAYKIQQQETVITNLESEYNSLGTADNIMQSLGESYVRAGQNNTYYVSTPELDEQIVLEAPSNWFDSVCEFFARLF